MILDQTFEEWVFSLMLLGFLMFVFIIIRILGAIWVYFNAKKRDMNVAVWLLIVILTGFCGCIIYLIVRQRKHKEVQLKS